MAFVVLRLPEEWGRHFSATDLNADVRSVVSVGTFDGIHLGHQKILRRVVERARATSQVAIAVTFDPHPMRVLRPEQAPPMIQTLAQRLAGFEEMGLNAALVLQFDRELSLLSPEDFLQSILVEHLRMSEILVGSNFVFGHRGAGDVRLLTEYGEGHDFEVEIVAPVELGGRMVSSTTIRTEIAQGEVTEAAELLGRAFSLTGKIHTGAGRGRTILFPTLNMVPEQELLPKLGVFATECTVEGNLYRSVTNVGTRPTFDGQGITVESHLFGFDQQITSGRMEVRFHKRLRDEKKFSGPDALRSQVEQDIAAAKEFFAGLGTEKGPCKQ